MMYETSFCTVFWDSVLLGLRKLRILILLDTNEIEHRCIISSANVLASADLWWERSWCKKVSERSIDYHGTRSDHSAKVVRH